MKNYTAILDIRSLLVHEASAESLRMINKASPEQAYDAFLRVAIRYSSKNWDVMFDSVKRRLIIEELQRIIEWKGKRETVHKIYTSKILDETK